MRKLATVFSLIVAIFLVGQTAAWACSISFEPSSGLVGKAGEEITIKGTIRWSHSRCVLRDDEVSLDLKNATLVSQTGWKKERRGLFTNMITVRLGEPGEARVTVFRECSKKGRSEGSVTINVHGAEK